MTPLLLGLAIAAGDAGVTRKPPAEEIHVIVIRGRGNHITKPHSADLHDSVAEELESVREAYPGAYETERIEVRGRVEIHYRMGTPVGLPDIDITVEFEERRGRWYSGPWHVSEIAP